MIVKKWLSTLGAALFISFYCCGCGTTDTPSSLPEGPISSTSTSAAQAEETSSDAASASKDNASETRTAGSSGTAALTAKPSHSTEQRPASTQGTKKTTASTTAVSTGGKSKNMVEFIGRFNRTSDGFYQFDWGGSTITAGFEGTKIGIRLRTLKTGNTPNDYLNVTIDDAPPFVLKTDINTVEYPLAENLKNGYHTVRVTKRTEATFSSQLQFEGFLYGTGKAAPAPGRENRRIEIFGDSISAGYGNEGKEAGFRLSEENIDLTYGAIAAKALHAEYTTVALSGHGCHISLSGSTSEVTPKYFDRLLYKTEKYVDFAKPHPDVVIIHLGTNDFAMNVRVDDYYKSYLAFVAKVRRSYPNAYIVCTTCGGTTAALETLDKVVDMRKTLYSDTKIGHFVGLFDDLNGSLGSDGHPSVYGHQQLADQLVVFIKKAMNW